jgi:ABC-type dipeptide/oligopeptide/nickel transport system permease component
MCVLKISGGLSMSQFFYILKRLGLSIITLLIIFTITFFLMNTIPGGPFTGEKNLPPNILHNLEVKFGLNQPLIVQYFTYFKNAITGDFGVSIKLQGRSVNEIITTYFPVSAKLGLLSIAIAMIIGTMLGILSALKNNKFADRAVMVASTIGTSVPSFVIATVSMILFGVVFQILPTYGLDNWQSYILPAFALSFFPLSFASRLMRSSMLDVVNQDYIKTARAKGLKESTVIFKHALRNAILPVVTYLGPLLAGVLTGSFIIERVFTIPGLGKFFIDSIGNRDYPVILGTTIFYGAFLISMNFIVDILYMFIDPRIKLKN